MSAVRTTSRLAMTLLVAALLTGLAADTAAAQDPYGNTTTTRPPAREVEATCSLSIPEGRPGDTVVATVNGVFLGENVRILFDGVQVGSGTAPSVAAASVGGAVQFNGAALAAQSNGTTSVKITFRVPNAAVGTHVVTAVGDTFSCFCNPNGAFRVLASKSARSLPRTGIYIALYLVLAAILLGIGSELVLRARRRRLRLLSAAEDDDSYTYASRR
jgi:outer membrane lipoprotein SlyB